MQQQMQKNGINVVFKFGKELQSPPIKKIREILNKTNIQQVFARLFVLDIEGCNRSGPNQSAKEVFQHYEKYNRESMEGVAQKRPAVPIFCFENPSIEFWFLLHYKPCSKQFENAGEVSSGTSSSYR
ncbi:hypothetical protein [Candidatus Haliotispira prima]|uniref:hypothetical protein n=1 Tax=Candidatus Haliotispira prima TaxID=3034016 RepID=UPI0038992120